MAVLIFPSFDTLRLVVASELVPRDLYMSGARVAVEENGKVWLETNLSIPRETLATLERIGIRLRGGMSEAGTLVHCWAAALPLHRTARRPEGMVLFELEVRKLAKFTTWLRRSSGSAPGIRLLADPYLGRAWVTTRFTPPNSWFEQCDDTIEAYYQQANRVWIACGWEHPLVEKCVSQDESVLLCQPDSPARLLRLTPPEPSDVEFALEQRHAVLAEVANPFEIQGCLRLSRCESANVASLWVLQATEADTLREVCRNVDERLLHHFEIAQLTAGWKAGCVLIRRVHQNDRSVQLPLSALGLGQDPRLPWLYLPAGFELRPRLRVNELARVLGSGNSDHLTWLEPCGVDFSIHRVCRSAFQPLSEQIDYLAQPRSQLSTVRQMDNPFAFAAFAIPVETTIELESQPSVAAHKYLESDTPTECDSVAGLFARSVRKISRWWRGTSQQLSTTGDLLPGEEAEQSELVSQAPSASRTRTVLSGDSLLHGRNWTTRRRVLEERLLSDISEMSTERRGQHWSELATAYSATGQAADSAVCWMNALWDCPSPPDGWLEKWAAAECIAARRNERSTDLHRWLVEPGRSGTGRVVAALTAMHGFKETPPADFIAALPRIQCILEQQFDDIPVRAAWLARQAIARCCSGDALGMARWHDLISRRLNERGPGLDLDEPSFLRFRGRVSTERFKLTRDWLVRIREPLRAWVERPSGINGLQAVGLASETRATSEYAQLMLAWGMGMLGERTTARDWSGRARKSLARAGGPRADPAAHALLGDLFLHRIKDAYEGHLPKPNLPSELQQRLERLPEFARYSVDRLREHSRILQPIGTVRAFRGRDLREFWGSDRLGERLLVLAARTDSKEIHEEAHDLLKFVSRQPSTHTVPRIVLALLDVARFLDTGQIDELIDYVPTALAWMASWVQAGRWKEAERGERLTRFQARILEAAFAAAPATGAELLLRSLIANGSSGGLLPAITTAAPAIFRAALRHEHTSLAEELMILLDPGRANWTNDTLNAERVGLAVGWYVVGDEETGHRILNATREALYLPQDGNLNRQTSLALAYAEALGFAPTNIALGRLNELFQRLDHVTVHSSSNCYFTLQPLRLIDTVIRSVVTDDFTLSSAARAWLDEDEFLIRRRIHSDMAAILQTGEL